MRIDFKNLSEEPTLKQIKLVEAIANELDLELPDEYTKEAYGEFIDVWKDEYYFHGGN